MYIAVIIVYVLSPSDSNIFTNIEIESIGPFESIDRCRDAARQFDNPSNNLRTVTYCERTN